MPRNPGLPYMESLGGAATIRTLSQSASIKRGRVRRWLSCASPVLAATRKRAECGAQFLNEYGGLLKGREMSAVGGFAPIEESRIEPLAPQSRRQKQFDGE